MATDEKVAVSVVVEPETTANVGAEGVESLSVPALIEKVAVDVPEVFVAVIV